MVLHLEPNCCEIRDLPAPSSNNNPDKIGYVSLKKKHQHQRTEEAGGGGGDDDQEEHSRKKKVKKNNSETEADSEDDSCFVALITASNLHQDALYLPRDLSSSNGLERRCRAILLTDGREGLWALDLRFDKSCDTFYISRGWASFCDENRKKAGGFFVFELMGKGEMPLLSFCPAESRGEKTSKKESLPVEPSRRKKINKEDIEKNSTPPSENRFVTFPFTQDGLEKSRRHLPLAFMRENGMDKPGMITMLGKDGTKWLVNLRWKGRNQMSLGNGWKKFATANGLETGESFTMESIWKDGTPMLSLVNTDSTSSTRQQGEHCLKEDVTTKPNSGNKTKKAKNSREEMRESSSAIENHRFVTLTLTLEDVRDCVLILPSEFMKANGINKLGKITLLGKNNMKWFAYLLSKDGIMALGCGWKEFCEANGVKIGESFTLEYINEQDATPVLEFCPKL